MGEDVTAFLDNVIAYERRYFCNEHLAPGRLYLQKGKDRVQDFVFKQRCVFALSGKDVEKMGIPKSVEDGVLPRIECSGEQIGSLIYESRKKGFSDDRIYHTITNARDSYLEERGLCESDFADRKVSRQVYEAVSKELKDFCFGK